MPDTALALLHKLAQERSLALPEYQALVEGFSPELAHQAAALARAARARVYGEVVFVRGLLEISNVCQNDCYYCGIRRSNRHCQRYTLGFEEVLACCREGAALGFSTFVLQAGESEVFSLEQICSLVRDIKAENPGCAVTLSLGEYPKEAYAAMKEVGADRYLLRHETADPDHYARLHPNNLSLNQRMACLYNLRDLGFQTGCGFMVGSPGQSPATLAKDLKFVEEFSPQMCGIGPFLPQSDTPFAHQPPGSLEMTCFLLSLLRLIHPSLLLPATTALCSLHPQGRERGILAGANVVMPNLSPTSVREKYALYDHKLVTGAESAQQLEELAHSIAAAGCRMSLARGDWQPLTP